MKSDNQDFSFSAALGRSLSSWPLKSVTGKGFQSFLQPENGPRVDFRAPSGEPALTPAEGVSWRIFASPISLFIGGVAAVIMEFGDERIAYGVWDHTDFKRDPLARMQRTGLAAMVTVYAAKSVAEKVIGHVVEMHDRVRGETPSGTSYFANDDVLLTWVQLTASYGFVTAYDRFVEPLDEEAQSDAYAEAEVSARLYGVSQPPRTQAEVRALIDAKLPELAPNPVLDDFLGVIRSPRAVPAAIRPIQGSLVRAAISIVPEQVQARLELRGEGRLSGSEHKLIRFLARSSAHIEVEAHPMVQARYRLRG